MWLLLHIIRLLAPALRWRWVLGLFVAVDLFVQWRGRKKPAALTAESEGAAAAGILAHEMSRRELPPEKPAPPPRGRSGASLAYEDNSRRRSMGDDSSPKFGSLSASPATDGDGGGGGTVGAALLARLEADASVLAVAERHRGGEPLLQMCARFEAARPRSLTKAWTMLCSDLAAREEAAVPQLTAMRAEDVLGGKAELDAVSAQLQQALLHVISARDLRT